MMDGLVNSLCPESMISCHSNHQTSRAFRADQSWRIYFAGSIKGVEVLSISLKLFFFFPLADLKRTLSLPTAPLLPLLYEYSIQQMHLWYVSEIILLEHEPVEKMNFVCDYYKYDNILFKFIYMSSLCNLDNSQTILV